MDIKYLLDTIEDVSKKLYPETPEVAKLCQALMEWERANISVTVPRYKDPYKKLLAGVEKRWRARLVKEG